MPHTPSSKEKKRKRAHDEGEEEKSSDGGWKAWARDLGIAAIIVVVVLGAIFAYTQVWPPLVVVESSSMQHSPTTSFVGVIDTGDLVFVQAAPTQADVVTYLQGRASGYSTYSDYGDVIIFNVPPPFSTVPIIHRAIMFVIPNGSRADVPDLAGLPASDWQGEPAESPYGLTAVTIHRMGFNHNLDIRFDLQLFVQRYGHRGYITMGDHNAPAYDTNWFPAQGDIIGHARGEIPWFGLLKLLLSPSSSCCMGWGDPAAPANSWSDLAIALVVLISLPFIVEAAGWAWSKYAWPWIQPHLRRRPEEPERAPPPEDAPDEDTQEPREGSSEP